jgi:hypothetical protein
MYLIDNSTTTNPCDLLPFLLPKIVLVYFSPIFEKVSTIYRDGVIFGIFCMDQKM